MTLTAKRTYPVDDLAVWKTHIGGERGEQIPMKSARTNPVVVGDSVIASLCSSQKIVGVNANTGKLQWSVGTSYLAGSHVDVYEGMVYGGSCQELMCIEPETGRVVWRFGPYQIEGEHIYSGPAFWEDRLIIGDRYGWLYCLTIDTGEVVWKAKVGNEDWGINSTACAIDGRVVACSIRGDIACFEIPSGARPWENKQGSGCISELLALGKDVLVPCETEILQVSLESGKLLKRWKYKDQVVTCVNVIGETVFAVVKDTAAEKRLNSALKYDSTSKKKMYNSELVTETVLDVPIEFLAKLTPASVDRLAGYPRYSMAHLCWDETKGLLTEATSYGVALFDLESKRRLVLIEGEEPEYGMQAHFSTPAVVGDRLYALTGAGDLYCLQHPVIRKRRGPG